MLIVGMSILPLVWFIKMQIDINAGGHKDITHLTDGLRTLWGHFLTIIFPTELIPSTDEQTTVSFIRVWLVRLGILTVILLLIKNKFRALDEKIWLFGIFSAIVLGFMLFAFSSSLSNLVTGSPVLAKTVSGYSVIFQTLIISDK